MQLLTSADGSVSELAFAPDGQALAAAVFGQGPFLWDIPATTAPKALSEYRIRSHGFTFSPDSSVVGWIGNTKRVEYERDTGDEHDAQLFEGDERVTAQAITGPDHRLVVHTAEPSVGFRLRCFVADEVGSWIERWVVGPNQTTCGTLIAGTATDRFFAWEASTERTPEPPKLVMRSSLSGQVLAATVVPTRPVEGFAARADGSEAVAFGNSNFVVWRPGKKPRKVRDCVRAMAYHPSGEYLLAANNDKLIWVFDTNSWAVVKRYEWSIGQLSAVAVSPEGTLAAAGGEKGQVVVWDLDL